MLELGELRMRRKGADKEPLSHVCRPRQLGKQFLLGEASADSCLLCR